jgi:hypothetical protein
VERLVLRVATLLDEVLGRFVLAPDLDQLVSGVGQVMLAEVGAQPTLPFLHLDHGVAPFRTAAFTWTDAHQAQQLPCHTLAGGVKRN